MYFSVSFIIALVISVTVHEFCHAWMATYLGDLTAKYEGRLTLSPLSHMDPVGTLLLFVAGFGWGRPVPFNPYNLQDPRKGAALISLAGPLSNLVLVIVFGLAFRFLIASGGPSIVSGQGLLPFMGALLQSLVNLNLVLMLFNLLPIPPLDGAKIFSLLLPGHILTSVYRYRNYGYVALIVVVFSDFLFGFSILGLLLNPFFDATWDLLLLGL